MASPKEKLRKLIEARDKYKAEMEALRNQIIGLEMAITVLEADGSEPIEDERQTRARRGNVKGALLDLLQEVGQGGLNALTAVEIAKRRGIDLDRGTISSLLSRLKRDGVVDHDGDRYRLRQPIADDAHAQGLGAAAH